jgi:HlyD family secretion protein
VGGILVRRSFRATAPTFETSVVEHGTIQAFVTATGNLNPVVNVQVGSQVSGNIKALYADFNTKVHKGQLIAQIDPAIFQAQVDAAAGAVSEHRATLATAKAQYLKTIADLAVSHANKDNLTAVEAKDRATFTNLQGQWQRSEGLFHSGIVSPQDHDSTGAAFEAAQAQLDADHAQILAAYRSIQSAEAQVVAAQAQLDAAKAQLKQTQASLAEARLNLDHTRIVAPVSGTVIARHFDVGQTVAASFQAPDLFDIGEDLTKMQVDTNVDEADVGAVRPGQVATFLIDAYPGTIFRGTVGDVRRAPINAQNVVTYDVVITAENPDLKLFPGMTAKVTILTSRQDKTLKVPNAALRFRPPPEMLARIKSAGAKITDMPQVYIVLDSGIDAIPVMTGITDGKFTQVTSAKIKEGDTVILRIATPNPQSTTPPSSVRRLPGT